MEGDPLPTVVERRCQREQINRFHTILFYVSAAGVGATIGYFLLTGHLLSAVLLLVSWLLLSVLALNT